MCEAGTYLDATADACVICGEGTYSEDGATSCTECPSRTTTARAGASSVDACRKLSLLTKLDIKAEKDIKFLRQY